MASSNAVLVLPYNMRRQGRAIPCNWRVIPCNIRRRGVQSLVIPCNRRRLREHGVLPARGGRDRRGGRRRAVQWRAGMELELRGAAAEDAHGVGAGGAGAGWLQLRQWRHARRSTEQHGRGGRRGRRVRARVSSSCDDAVLWTFFVSLGLLLSHVDTHTQPNKPKTWSCARRGPSASVRCRRCCLSCVSLWLRSVRPTDSTTANACRVSIEIDREHDGL